MKNKKFLLRVLALCLALVCTFSLAAVAADSNDKNDDGIVNVWDVQIANAEDKTTILSALLGGGDELHPNAQGVYEIYSPLGLYNMAKNAAKGYNFKLMRDVDLGGREWPVIAAFSGNFDGNDKIVSNFQINKNSGSYMGFFAAVDYNGKDADGNTVQSVVQNLHLRDVVVTVPVTSSARFVGLLAGNNRGQIINCTTMGVINDARTKLPNTGYYGTIIGNNSTTAPTGKLTVSNSMDALDYYDFGSGIQTCGKFPYQAPAKVSSMMAMNFAELSYPEGTAADKRYQRTIGIAGYTNGSCITNAETQKTGENCGLVWQDITNSSYFDSQTLRDRRTRVAAEMYEMCTVKWYTPTTLTYTSFNAGDSNYSRAANLLWLGIPYNHGASSIHRFIGYMEEGADNVYKLKSEVPTVGYYFNNSEYNKKLNTAYDEYINAETTNERKQALAAEYPALLVMTEKASGSGQAGFMKYIGADCSSQALWAWRTVNATAGTGGVTSTHTNNMYMCDQYIKNNGIVPVNNFKLELPTTDLDGDKTVNDAGDRSLAVKEKTRADKAGYMETLGCVTKGDLLMDYTDAGGHTLMALSDAVVIRNHKGVLDTAKSHIVTGEQGSGTNSGTLTSGYGDLKNGNWKSTCCVGEVQTFDALFDVTAESEGRNYPSCFFPITCAALQEEDTPAAKVTVGLKNGVVDSNFQIVSSTIIKGDVRGETVYAQIQQKEHRAAYNQLNVAEVHPDVANGDIVEVRLGDGKLYTFTYTAPAA